MGEEAARIEVLVLVSVSVMKLSAFARSTTGTSAAGPWGGVEAA